MVISSTGISEPSTRLDSSWQQSSLPTLQHRNDLTRPVIRCLVERCLLSEGRCMNKPASCTPTPFRGKWGCVGSSTGALITCPHVLHAAQTQGQWIKRGRFRGPWRHNGLACVRLFSLHKRRSRSMEQILCWFSHLHHCHDNSGFDGIIWFSNEDLLLIIQLKRLGVVCLWRPFKSTTCPSDSSKLDLKKHTLKLDTSKSAAGLWAASSAGYLQSFFHTSLIFISIKAGMGWKQLGVVANHHMDLFYGM